MGLFDSERGMDAAAQQGMPPTGAVIGDSRGGGSGGGARAEGAHRDAQFPAGLRVLVVDDDPICLLILDRMLRRCLYEVTTCGRATTALAMLRESKDKFDLVISDVYMPDMDGFKLLELVGLEMDLPVIMMSANGETSAVMKGITHGACDYLLKPVRMEELKNIWQHVVRKKWRESEYSSGHDERHTRGTDDGDTNSSASDGPDGNWKPSKKRKDATEEEEEELEHESDDPSTSKKPRVVWSVELHQQFVTAVNQLGIDKAVPKRLLEIMNVPGLTRENVASHLQKYRLYLKRISGVTHQQGNLNSSFAGSPDSPFNTVSGGVLGGPGDLRTLVAIGQLSPQVLMSTLQAGLLGKLGAPSELGMAGADPSLLLQQAAIEGVNCGALLRPTFGQPLLNNNVQGDLQRAMSSGPGLKQLLQLPQQVPTFGQLGASLDKGQAGISAVLQQLSGTTSVGSVGQLVGVNSNMPVNPNDMMQMIQQQTTPQMMNAGTLNFPSSGLLVQHMLSNGIDGTRYTAPLSAGTSFNSNISSEIGALSIGRQRPGQGSALGFTGFSSSNVLGICERKLDLDNGGLQLPSSRTGNISISTNTNVSSPLISTSTGLEDEMVTSGIKGMRSTFVGINDTIKGMGSNFNSLSGLNHGFNVHIGDSSRQDWQDMNVNHNLGQTLNPILSPRYSQNVSSSPGLNVGSGEERGKGRIPSFPGQSVGLICNTAYDRNCLNPPTLNTPSFYEQSMTDSEPEAKYASVESSVGPKAESGLLLESFTSSDDLLNIFFKQPGLAFSEGGLGVDPFKSLDSMYAK